MTLRSVNPATGERIRDYQEMERDEVDRRLDLSREAFAMWRATSSGERARRLESAAAILRSRKQELGRLMTEEMGKPIKESVSEIEKCAWVSDYYADNGEDLLAPEDRPSDARHSFVRFDPLGPVLAIMPWNFPFWQVFRFAAPALTAGNVALLKHASNVPGCALAIEEIFRDAGFPEGCFQTLLVSSSEASELIGDSRIAAATLTGSDRAGSKVGEAAGRALKKAVLELGGSDPFVVLEDARVDEAARVAVRARTINSGQSCIAAKRFIVHAKHFARFQERFVSGMKALVVGDPMDERTEIGPLAREDLLDELDRQVGESVKEGARLLCGGKRLDREGFFYEPTALTDLERHMAAVREETFGPVAAILPASSDDEAIAIANDSPFGLGASLWTEDPEKGKALAARVEAGCVFINDFVKSDPRLPFGGVKRSGYGRELSREGIREFTNIKTVHTN